MSDFSRRSFLGAAAAAAGAAAGAGAAEEPRPRVLLHGDGVSLSPAEYAALLARLAQAPGITPDEYGLGGSVAEHEAWFARLLGKERALFMPTGTLANHLALRALAGGRARVVVQEVSHVYNDAGDSAQALSGLSLVPLAPEQATFGRADVERVLARTATARVESRVAAVSIESPVRRLRGATFDQGEMRAVSALCREKGIRLHLDGARLFVASAYSGLAPADYAALFDTVYVSLWKCFGAPQGAVLAGPASVLEGLHHARRMFGGALWSFWPFAAVARHYAEGYVDRLRRAVAVSEDFLRAGAYAPAFTVERVAGGTNVFRLRARLADAEAFRRRLAARGVDLGPGTAGAEGVVFPVQVNETWNGTTGAALAEAFARAV
jgi:threonine aldolase